MSESIESYLVNGKLFISTKFLSAHFNRSDKQISRWKKDGLPIAVKPKELNKRGDYFIFEDVIKWHEENINKVKANNSRKSEDDIDVEDEELLFDIYANGTTAQKRKILLTLSQNRLDNFRKIEDIIKKEGDNKELDSKYALVENVRRGEQELASVFISLLKNSMPVLSKILENKTQDEIYHALDRHFKKEMNKIIRYIKTDEEIVISLDKIIQTIVDLVSEKNITHAKILQKIEELS